MKINWKLRFQNKAILTAILLGIISIVYKICAAKGIIPAITESEVVQIIEMIIDVLVLLGVVIDPTTSGISDSEQALTYATPK